jgi:phenylacetate-coenzyme A ligase PaaK-like adenylate-forming protein
MDAKEKAWNVVKYAYKKVPLYYQMARQRNLPVQPMDFDKCPMADKAYYAGLELSCLLSEDIGTSIGQRLR